MNGSAATTAIIAVIAVCACAGLVVYQEAGAVTPEYTITYELNGGENSADNPSSYRSGETVTLADPSYYGYSFNGWFSDAEFTQKVTEVSGGDATVYASWTELVSVGTITYVLDGGTNSPDNPDMRYEGVDITLSAASREGYFFNGWNSTAEHSDIVETIPSDTEGDVTLYAWWVEIYEGEGFTMSYTSTGSNWYHSSGTLTVEYLYYNEDRGFYARNTVTSTGGSPSVSTYWTAEEQNEDVTWTYKGMQQVYAENIDGGKTVWCEVYEGTSETVKTVQNNFFQESIVTTTSETQYIYGGWIPVSIVYEKNEQTSRGPFDYTTTYRVEYTLQETFSFTPEDVFDVDVYADVGITVQGDGSHEATSDVTLTASASSGYRFTGWYDADGNLLSSSSTYTITSILSDTKIYALNADATDFSYANGESVELYHVDGLTDITWTVTNKETGAAEEYTGGSHVFSAGGYYSVTYSGTLDGESYHGCYTLFADGYVTKTFEWQYNGTGYSYDLNILYTDFLGYRNSDVTRSHVSAEKDLGFITADDVYIQKLAEYFLGLPGEWSDYDRMTMVLNFTQYIEYQSDSTYMGQSEYWKYPLETLFDQGGDCEDTSILFCSIASAMHYESAMLLFYGHMAASVALPDGSITQYQGTPSEFPSDDGKTTYYYCETTSTGFAIGKSPEVQGVENAYDYEGYYYNLGGMGDVISVAAS